MTITTVSPHPLLPSVHIVNEKIVSINLAFQELTGLLEENIINKNSFDYIKNIKYRNVNFRSLASFVACHKNLNEQVQFTATIDNENKFPLPVKVTISLDHQNCHCYDLYFQSFSNRAYDPVSNLPNGWAMRSRAQYIVTHCSALETKMVIVIIDVNNFATINYRYGFEAGDQYLERLGKALQLMASPCLVVRYSNAKFGILVEDNEQLSIVQFKQKITKLCQSICELSDIPLILDGNISVKKTFRIGVSAQFSNYQNYHAMEIAAETALRELKGRSASAYNFTSSKAINKLLTNMLIIDEFPNALAQNKIDIYYQPQYSLKTNKLIGMEALSRWKHPSLGNVAPDLFVHIAEKTGMHFDFDLWVFERVCLQVMAWKFDNVPVVKVAINISFKTAEMDDFIPKIQNILDKTCCPAYLLEIEVTETSSINNKLMLKNNIIDLNKMGFSIAVDDFGSGYSSLCLLHDFHQHFNKIKLDRSLINNVGKTDKERFLVKNIIKMCGIMHLKVLAEGVEEEEQLVILRELGCNSAQGYFFNKALNKNDSKNLLVTEIQ